MKDSGMSRRSLFSRPFGGVALAAGATAANAHVGGIERPAPDAPCETASYTFDGEGRLLSVAYDGATPSAAAASLI